MLSAVLIRNGSNDDVAALAELMFVDPLPEAVALARGVDNARRLEVELLDRAVANPGSLLLVAVDGDEQVGFALFGDGSDVPSFTHVAAMAVRTMGVAGALAAAWPASSRMAVDMAAPSGGLHLSELHVHPDHRGRGIGGTLLEQVADHARATRQDHVSLTTGTTNPARRLYERHGFAVVRERAGRRYARLTGVPGRVLMMKPLSEANRV